MMLETGVTMAAVLAISRAIEFLSKSISNRRNGVQGRILGGPSPNGGLTHEQAKMLEDMYVWHSEKDQDGMPRGWFPRSLFSGEIKGLTVELNKLNASISILLETQGEILRELRHGKN